MRRRHRPALEGKLSSGEGDSRIHDKGLKEKTAYYAVRDTPAKIK